MSMGNLLQRIGVNAGYAAPTMSYENLLNSDLLNQRYSLEQQQELQKQAQQRAQFQGMADLLPEGTMRTMAQAGYDPSLGIDLQKLQIRQQQEKRLQEQARQRTVSGQDAYGNPILINKATGAAGYVQGIPRYQGLGSMLPSPADQEAPALDQTSEPRVEGALPGEERAQTLMGEMRKYDQRIGQIDAAIAEVPRQEVPRLQALKTTLEKRRAATEKRLEKETSSKISGGQETDLVGRVETIGAGLEAINNALAEIDKAPGDFGVSGGIKGAIQTSAGVAKDVSSAVPVFGSLISRGADMATSATSAEGDFVSRLKPIENVIASSLAQARFPQGRPPQDTVMRPAREDARLTGLTSSEQVRAKLLQLRDETLQGLQSMREQATVARTPEAQSLIDRYLGDGAEGAAAENTATQTQSAQPQGQMPAEARQAPDGNFYVPDPQRPGKYLMVVQ